MDQLRRPVLTTLIGNAIGGNLGLQQAVLRVVESRQGEVSAGAAALPTVSGNGSYVREQLGLRGLLLSRGAFDQARRDRIPEAVKPAEMTLYLARDSYKRGLVDFIQVLDAQRTLVTIRQQLVQADVALINDVVGLYNALGGGWQAAGWTCMRRWLQPHRRSRLRRWTAWWRRRQSSCHTRMRVPED